MEKAEHVAKRIALNALQGLDLDTLNRLYHEAWDRMIEAGLHQQAFDITEPVMEYFIDGIDAAADDENQSHLKRIVATAYMAMCHATLRDDIDQAQRS